jgi:hypothetical protein
MRGTIILRYPFIRRLIKLTVVIIKAYKYYQLYNIFRFYQSVNEAFLGWYVE